MKYLFFVLFSLLILKNNIAYSDILPNDLYSATEVVEIQMTSLQSNSISKNQGIFQCWLFAHPKNKKFTGPFSNFTSMISDTSYNILLNSFKFKVKLLSEEKNIAKVSVEVDAKNNKRYNLIWILEKANLNKKCKKCWMTVSVTEPEFKGLLN